MPLIQISPFARTPATDAEGSFKTHANYLRAFAHLAGFGNADGDPAPVLDALAVKVRATPLWQQLVTQTPDRPQLGRSLAAAWGAELILILSGEYATEDELRRLNNNWSAVQLYYVVHHAIQSFVVAGGDARPTKHDTTQKAFMNQWVQRDLNLAPWTFGVTSQGYRNAPEGQPVDDNIHPWKTCDDGTSASLAAKALETTRRDAVPGVVQRRREEKRRVERQRWHAKELEKLANGRRARAVPKFALPRLSAAERQAAEKSIRPYSVMDYLYRLRIKTNYEDASMFTDGPTDTSSSKLVHRDFANLASATLLVHELFISRLAGETFNTILTQWLKAHPSAQRKGIGARRGLLL